MDTSTIALRFRDTTPGVDTISAHEALISQYGYVWWGWWRKEFEPEHTEFLHNFNETTQRTALLVNRQTVRMYSAQFERAILSDQEQIEPHLVPEYYREKMSQIFGWFLLKSIEQIDFNPDIAREFGDRTLLVLDRRADQKSQEPREGPEFKTLEASGRASVLHLSDLHFGADYAFLPQDVPRSIGESKSSLTKCLTEDLCRVGAIDDIGTILVTGDFITRGDWSDANRKVALDEFKELRSALKIGAEQIVPVPGNHDIERYPDSEAIDVAAISVDNQLQYKHEREYRTFVDQLNGSDWKDPLNFIRRIQLAHADVLICALNSCAIVGTKWTEYGYVGDAGLDVLNRMKSIKAERPTYKILALHHHLLPVAQIEAPRSSGVSLSLDASALLDAAQDAGVHVAVHGHQHMPRLVRYQTLPFCGTKRTEPIYVISNGSTGVIESRLPGNERNAYCLFRLRQNGISLLMRELRPDARAGSTLFDADLELMPAVPSQG